METGTFPNRDLQEYIEKYFIPVKYTSGIDSEQFSRYGVTATPEFIVLDAEGDEIYRKIGYFKPDLLIEQLEKARKKAVHKVTHR
jgi:thioredoxin-related protein